MLRAPGRGERIPYSIASAPEETSRSGCLEFLVKPDASEWGQRLARLRRGAKLELAGPVGRFVFPEAPDEREFLFVAGGTGIAPLRSMIVHALSSPAKGRLSLLYSARTPSDFAYLGEMREYERQGRLTLALTATREVPARWQGEKGRITAERLEALVRTPQTLCFVCGPAAMVDEVPRMLLDLGVRRERIRLEEW